MNDVPKIQVNEDRTIRSTSTTPTGVTDTAACWTEANRRRARRFLTQPVEIVCLDATAHTAMLALSIETLCRGLEVKAKIKVGYAN